MRENFFNAPVAHFERENRAVVREKIADFFDEKRRRALSFP